MNDKNVLNPFDMLLYQERSQRLAEKQNHQPTATEDKHLLHIIKVMDSCKNIDQLMNTRDWGLRVLADIPMLATIVDVKFDDVINKLSTGARR